MPRGVPNKAKKKRYSDLSEEEIRNGWLDRFKGAALRVGFQINLTRPMLEFLCAVADGVAWDRSGLGASTINCPDNWIATEHSLVKRGLVMRKPLKIRKQQLDDKDNELWETTPVELTDAGKIVVDLIKLSGVFIESDHAINKKNRTKGA